MRALNNGAYKNFREFYAYATTIPSLAIGDSFMLPNDGAGNYIQATTWTTTGFSQVLTGNMYTSAMSAFHNENYTIHDSVTTRHTFRRQNKSNGKRRSKISRMHAKTELLSKKRGPRQSCRGDGHVDGWTHFGEKKWPYHVSF